MSTLGADLSANGHASESCAFTHLSLDRPSAGYCRVTFEHPPS
jgi:hypothetical protein